MCILNLDFCNVTPQRFKESLMNSIYSLFIKGRLTQGPSLLFISFYTYSSHSLAHLPSIYLSSLSIKSSSLTICVHSVHLQLHIVIHVPLCIFVSHPLPCSSVVKIPPAGNTELLDHSQHCSDANKVVACKCVCVCYIAFLKCLNNS